MTNLSRRNLLGKMLQGVAITGAVAAGSAVAILTEPDAAIFALEREYAAAVQAEDASRRAAGVKFTAWDDAKPSGMELAALGFWMDDNPHHQDRVAEIMQRAAETPVTTVAGMAAKLRIAAHYAKAELTGFERDADGDIVRSVLDDLRRMVPA